LEVCGWAIIGLAVWKAVRLGQLMEVAAAPGFDENEILRLGAALERASEHPLAAAIVAGATERELVLPDVKNFRSVTGRGVMGEVGAHTVAIGNQGLMDEQKLELGGLAKQADALRSEGQTVMFIAVDNKAAGLIGVADHRGIDCVGHPGKHP
jgi:Cu+-exporting ATPase